MKAASAVRTRPTMLEAVAASPVQALRTYRRRRVPGAVNLASNELRHPVLERLAGEALSDLPAADLAGYPSGTAVTRLLADRLRTSPESLLLVAGSDDAYRLLTEALGPTLGAAAVTQQLNYQSLPDYARLRGLELLTAPYLPQRHAFDTAELIRLQAARPGRAVVWLSNPNGPTGAVHTPEELENLCATVAAAGNLLVVDEVYRDFQDGPRWAGPARTGHHRHLLRLRSFSKGYGLAGARLGYLHGHPDLISYLARWNTPGPVSVTALHLAAHLLRHGDEVAAVHREVAADRAWFATAADALPGFTALPSQGNFVAVRAGTDQLVRRGLDALAEEGITVRDLRPLGVMGPVLRVGMAQRPVLRRALTALSQAADDQATRDGAGAGRE
ncbi:pyridoxal phosphate-dependent aminotransferase [Streptomyces sp. HF10]|uniref:pyridoxal phosphate-dependent aminotransferase n=1 Tax=Streptomyces sp. HF10 TaxID=2692233 RepID=UPI0013196BEC|nr:aminotransferase class I/II-fold pyridoxal phosphate-dependent enzyme [Streptomyces sp. HF10]QHC32658.1 aminotransferase class I/II-fold pyridoxal phosphate-dependent enzyme [Streptomyces sp. HF10]